MRRSLLYFGLALTVALASCGGNEYTYTNFHCNLYIDNSAQHHDATLASAMNAMSPGVFCRISYEASSRSYLFYSNQGQTSRSVFSAIDVRRGNAGRIGMNNGLIVGYGNLSMSTEALTYEFYAFDNQCPNCFDYNSLPRRNYPLTMSSAGIATCDNCHRQYNMNTGGNCINSSSKADKGMTLYRATSTGAYGTLFVE